MRSWQLVVAGLACLVTAGCRTDPNIPLLERELRVQEDEIYRLRGVIEDYQDALRTCREQGGRTNSDSTGKDGLPGLPELGNIPAPTASPPAADAQSFGDPDSEAPPSPFPISPLSEPAEFPADGSGNIRPPAGPGGLGLSIPEPSEFETPDPGINIRPISATRPLLPAESRDVATMELDRTLTAGYDADGRPGDDGIVLGLRLRDAEGRVVGAPAAVSVVVLDPAAEGEAARVARWDLSAAETSAGLWRSASGGALRLELPWPAAPPQHGQLYLFARYTTDDGRDLQTEGPIDIALPGQGTSRWVSAQPVPVGSEANPPTALDDTATDWPDTIEPRQVEPHVAVRMPTRSSPVPAEPMSPTPARLERPVWSPNRP